MQSVREALKYIKYIHYPAMQSKFVRSLPRLSPGGLFVNIEPYALNGERRELTTRNNGISNRVSITFIFDLSYLATEQTINRYPTAMPTHAHDFIIVGLQRNCILVFTVQVYLFAVSLWYQRRSISYIARLILGVPSQWDAALLCNDGSHWLCANLESALNCYLLLIITTQTSLQSNTVSHWLSTPRISLAI